MADKLNVTLVSTGPALKVELEEDKSGLSAGFTPHALMVGVRDVRVEGETIVDSRTRIADLKLGEGLAFVDGRLKATGNTVQYVILRTRSGTLTPEQAEALDGSKENHIQFGSTVYSLAMRNGDQLTYYALDKTVQFDHININTTTRAYEILERERNIYDDHIENAEIHITNDERLFWNNKVSCTNPEGTDLLIFTTK